MQIRMAFDITVAVTAPTPALLALLPRPEEMPRISSGPIAFSAEGGPIEPHLYRDSFGNARTRLLLPPGRTRMTWDGIATDSGLHEPVHPDAVQHPVEDLPDGVLQFLQPSRYVESDRLLTEAWDRFGAVQGGWAKVQAICDFVHGHLNFDYGTASPFRTAYTSLAEGQAVCRDFAHLVIGFARALNIPARYASGYLGDIDWPDMGEGDFCAWVEVFIGGRWYTFDARYNAPRIGRVVMVRGRDAADVPMITSFGNLTMESFKVWCDEVPGTRTQLNPPIPVRERAPQAAEWHRLAAE